jgi:hypothetical protein
MPSHRHRDRSHQCSSGIPIYFNSYILNSVNLSVF